jgi:hypothetical protein
MQYLYDILKITILVIDIKHMKDNLCLIVAFIINSFLIGNMDQTPVFFNMTENRTVSFKGIKTVSIKTQNQDKSRCSVFLTITAYVDKLPQLFIFMAK